MINTTCQHSEKILSLTPGSSKFHGVKDSEGEIIDPFTVLGLISRNDRYRKDFMSAFKDVFGLKSQLPKNFYGAATQPAFASIFCQKTDRTGVKKIWTLFKLAMNYSHGKQKDREMLEKAINEVLLIDGVMENSLTTAMFWTDPLKFPARNGMTIKFIDNSTLFPSNIKTSFPLYLKKLVKQNKNAGQIYLQLADDLKKYLIEANGKIKNFIDLNEEAWKDIKGSQQTEKVTESDSPGSTHVEGGSSADKLLSPLVSKEESQKEMPATDVEKISEKAKKFLEDVFWLDGQQDRIKEILGLIVHRQNLILAGPPGVGKTFSARKLAYALMGEEDDSRIEWIQFHQSYSYEDFIMGFRPEGDSFKPKPGVFFKFCEKVASSPNQPFFFIIDEINRGNISRIFGELFSLIEPSMRKQSIPLPNANGNDPLFKVPENLYIIGTMNTADKSLAVLDYALRRRFAFFKIEPAFNTFSFKSHQQSLHNHLLDELVDLIASQDGLNTAISSDSSLGEDFCIGHSYFCGLTDKNCTQRVKEIIDYDLKPLLAEYWDDDKEKFEEWKKKLDEIKTKSLPAIGN